MQTLRFEQPVLAYSDQPVVVWPFDVDEYAVPPTEPTFGPLNALEVRVALTAQLMLLMTWMDRPDALAPVDADPTYAAESNTLVIAQADKQWMHKPGSEPPCALAPIRPLSRGFEDGYNVRTATASQRRARAAHHLHRVRNKRFLNDIDVVFIKDGAAR